MKITVITVCLNSGKTIEKTIKSVIKQKRKDLDIEYIVVDGGSTDETMTIIQEYAPYIAQYVSETDNGIFDAMNKGIGMASGDVIAFLNSDDWYEENALSSVMQSFADHDCDCVCCDNYVMGRNGRKEYFDASKLLVEDLYIQMIYYHSSIFGKKELFKKCDNFDIKYKFAADYDWFLKTVEKGARLQYVHQPVFTFCYGGASSVNEIECAREARKIALSRLPIEKGMYRDRIDRRLCEVVLHALGQETFYPKLIEILGKKQTNILWGAGARGIKWVSWFLKSGIEIEAIIDSNSSLWGSFIGMVPVCSPEILNQVSCNLIITPEKYVDEIKYAISARNNNICIFELNILCKMLAESAVDGLLA